MRVALVGPYPVDGARVEGGLQTSFVSLVEALRSASGVDTYVLTFRATAESRHETTIGDVPVWCLPATPHGGALTRFARERRSLAEALATLRPDVVHAQDTLSYGYTSLKATRREPVVVSVHGVIREEVRHIRELSSRMRVRWLGVPLESYCIRRARFLISPTSYAAEYFGDEIQGRIWDVANPIAASYFSVDSEPDLGTLLFSGSLIPRKRLLDLIEALPHVRAAYPDVTLRVAGSEGDVAYADRVRRRISELGLADRVVLLGSLAPAEMLHEYRRAAMLVLPSAQETSPMVIAEAMAACVPVVATDVGGVRHLVEHGRTGYLVGVGDIEGLAARIVDLLLDPVGRAHLGIRARQSAERFRPPVVALDVREIYDEIRRSHRLGRSTGT
jgi:glycosyltransferase involved in cell wall biosynthesis